MAIIGTPRLVTHRQDIGPAWVRVLDGFITGVSARPIEPSPGESVTELPDGVLAPGFVDAQINGAFGVDFAQATEPDWKTVCRGLPSTGTTSFVPTYITAPLEELLSNLERQQQAQHVTSSDPHGARVLGAHFEGPFLAPTRRGAHPAQHLRRPDPDLVARLLPYTSDQLCYVTLAPELPGALAAVAQLTAAGIRVSVGHSDADHHTVHAAADAGATLVTHLYNAQRALHHRDPGVVGAALTDPRLTSGLIVDLHHVEPTAVRVAFAAAPDRIMLVTDSVAAMGMPEGTYLLGGSAVTSAHGGPPLREDGTIAGAALTLYDAVSNTVSCGISLPTAIDAATRIPADALGQPLLGRIEPGAYADLVWLHTQGSTVKPMATWVNGNLAWHDPAAEWMVQFPGALGVPPQVAAQPSTPARGITPGC